MKIIENVEIEASSSLPEYLVKLNDLINDEMEAINGYDSAIDSGEFDNMDRDKLVEILNDEIDHLVILKDIFNEKLDKLYQGYGES